MKIKLYRGACRCYIHNTRRDSFREGFSSYNEVPTLVKRWFHQ